jgi:UDP-N-acetylglucosamine 2-epimerase
MIVCKIAVIAAERGGFVRAAPLVAELSSRPELEVSFIFAGEDYPSHASSEVFRELALPYADVVIAASEGTPAQRLAKVMAGCERFALSGNLAAVVLVGSSPAILGCALASVASVPVVAHADAGLRLPGSAGRTSLAACIDRLSTALMAASEQAHNRLLDEGALEDSVLLTGSLACDPVAQCIERARAAPAAASPAARAGL